MDSVIDDREAHCMEILDRLYETYPDSTISLNFSNRLELLIAVILSAQCTDERVNAVTSELFNTYPSVDAFADADQDVLAEDIGSITYFNSKASYIRESCQQIRRDHDGHVPDTMEALTELPGVGRKTANVVLQHGHNIRKGVVVDTHVQRLSRRLGLTDKATPESIEAELMTLLPKKHWQEFTHLMISHGRETCTARNPDCESCVLADRCPSDRTTADIDLASGDSWH